MLRALASKVSCRLPPRPAVKNSFKCTVARFSGLRTQSKSGSGRKDCSSLSTVSTATCDDNTHALPDILSLPASYLRGMDAQNFDPSTNQRNDVLFDDATGKPILQTKNGSKYDIRACKLSGNEYRIKWGDGVHSTYSKAWVEQVFTRWKSKENSSEEIERILWTDLDESDIRSSSLGMSISFSDLTLLDEAGNGDGMSQALRALYQYGILLVTNTPVDDGGAGIAALASSVSGGANKTNPVASLLSHYNSSESSKKQIVLPHGTDGPLRTIWGTVWSTVSTGQADGVSVADSAYGQGALPLHTDMTYHQNPPGLQIFTMVSPAGQGGESVFGDGFSVANRLKETDADAFNTLSTLNRTYHNIDKETGWHLEAHGPVISTRNGQLVQIRHNDLDRLSDLPSPLLEKKQFNSFYERVRYAHDKWDELLTRDEFRLVMGLKPGDTVVVANHVSNSLIIVFICLD